MVLTTLNSCPAPNCVAASCDFAAAIALSARLEESAALAWGSPAVAAVETATTAALTRVTSLRI